MRTDLVKELERQQRKLQSWAEVPGVDQERINELRHQLKQSSSTLMAAPRIGQFLREDRLIALVRQRLSIRRLLQLRFTDPAYLAPYATGASR